MLPVIVDPAVPRNMEHPGLEVAFLTKRIPVFQHPEEDILDEIFGDAPAARHFCKEIEEPAVMPVEQQAQLFHIAVFHGHHQVFVRLNHLASKNFLPAKRLHNQTKRGKETQEAQEAQEKGPSCASCASCVPSTLLQRTGFGYRAVVK